ncbi:MAG: FecR domain-containing protein, partial [Planctomycetes bacterium]|nr:FecR domain-containing protein [Planctomycetota bacterium]
MSQKKKQELRLLIDMSLDQELSSDQVKRLDELIVHDPEARRYYLEQIALVTQLHRRQSMDGSLHEFSTASESPKVWQRSVLGFRGWFACAVASIAILGVTLFFISWLQSRRISTAPALSFDRRDDSAGETIATVVASDTKSINAGFSRGDRLKAGHFQIGSGAISLVLRNGVTLDMEGPLDFDIKSLNLLELKNGTVRARVPETESQFVIKAPDLEVQDLGTEFGLSVRDHRTTELHVFDGAVELRGHNGEHEIIREGTALSWAHGVRLVKDKTEESSFATPDAIGFRNWQAYFETIRRDPASVICFDFQNLENSNRVMNQALGNPGRANAIVGEVHGPMEVSGRWVPKESLLFEKGSSRVEFEVPGKFETYTLSTWVCLTRLADSLQAIFTTHAADPGELHLQIERDGAVRMGV